MSSIDARIAGVCLGVFFIVMGIVARRRRNVRFASWCLGIGIVAFIAACFIL